jgi:hypothetical protein
VGKPEEMRLLGRCRCRWEDNIVTCLLSCMTNNNGFGLDDWIY